MTSILLSSSSGIADMHQTEALYIDIKTRSVCDRRKVDPWTYAGNWATDVWVMGFAVGHGEVQLWHPGEPLPEALIETISSGAPIFCYDAPFHHALFAALMRPRYGWPMPLLEQWGCAAAMAAAVKLPNGLDEAATAKGVGGPKDKEARSLIRRMARPRSKTHFRCLSCGMMTCDDHEMWKTSLVWWDGVEDRALLDSYCIQDVLTGRALVDGLPPLSESQHEAWLRDQVANDHSTWLEDFFSELSTDDREISAEMPDSNRKVFRI